MADETDFLQLKLMISVMWVTALYY